jgi:hypothetical protein
VLRSSCLKLQVAALYYLGRPGSIIERLPLRVSVDPDTGRIVLTIIIANGTCFNTDVYYY